MKLRRLSLFAILSAFCLSLALGALTRRSCAAEDLWQSDFKAAQAQAKQEKKYLLVDFTGSDWCGWCIKLHNEVFDKEAFKAEAPKQFVLVELDFPHQKEQSEELKKQNKELSEKYNVEGFPTVLMLDAEGQLIARTGYREGGPEGYLKQLGEFSKIYENVVALKARLKKVQGLARARLLDAIIEGYEKLGNESDEVAAWGKEIIALDPENKTGLKVKYEFPRTLAEAENLLRVGKSDEAGELIDKALALKGVPAEMRQQGYMTRSQVYLMEKKFTAVVATLKEAKEAAPESQFAKRIDAFIAQFDKVAEAQEKADKLEARLAKSEGIDRAKLLDKVIDAKQKLLPYDPQAGANVKKWTKEIIALDADNKAGLKKKYQFRMVLADALELMRADKADEANAVLDKALASAGDSGEEVQQAQLCKAQLAFMHHDQKAGVACLKKALAAAPKGEFAPKIELMLRQFQQAKQPIVKEVDE